MPAGESTRSGKLGRTQGGRCSGGEDDYISALRAASMASAKVFAWKQRTLNV